VQTDTLFGTKAPSSGSCLATNFVGPKMISRSIHPHFHHKSLRTSHDKSLRLLTFMMEESVAQHLRSLRYRGADKFLEQPGRKQVRKHIRDARDFNSIETRAIIKLYFPARQGAEGNSRHSDRNISLFPSWSG